MGSKERRQREKEQRKEEILDAARTILLKKGMPAVSMNQIARSAELSVGTLYLYFKNKEELFATLQEEGLDILHEMIREAAGRDDTPARLLIGMAQAYLDFSEQHRSYFDIINYFLTSPEVIFPDELKARVDEHGDRILSIVQGVLLKGYPEKKVEMLRAKTDALIFWATLQGMLQLRKLRDTVLSEVDFRPLYLHGVQRFAKIVFETE